MSLIWYILIIFIILFLLVMFSYIKVQIVINKENKNDFIEITTYLFYNIFKIRKKIPIILFESLEEGIKYESKTNTIGTGKMNIKKDRIPPKKILKWRKQYKNFLKRIHDFYGVMKKFLKHVYIDLYKWETKIGSGDAMNTGILNGFVWQAKGIILSYATNLMILNNKPIISVTPDFNNKIYISKFECILRFRVGYLILTGIRLLYKLIQGGEKIGRWRTSYPRTNENSYGKS